MRTRNHLGQASRLEGRAGSPQHAAARQKSARWGHCSLPALFSLLFFATCLSARSRSYSIDWYEISGGGGTRTGATYQVTGTIGQPDASSAMSGGPHFMTGGFRSLIAVVQTPGLPNLSVADSGNSVIASCQSTASETFKSTTTSPTRQGGMLTAAR